MKKKGGGEGKIRMTSSSPDEITPSPPGTSGNPNIVYINALVLYSQEYGNRVGLGEVQQDNNYSRRNAIESYRMQQSADIFCSIYLSEDQLERSYDLSAVGEGGATVHQSRQLLLITYTLVEL